MSFEEHALCIDCNGDRLVGVLAQPHKARRLAVLVIVGGPQYRVGSHRQFAQMARALAAAGYPVLRFDVRGMGDSEGAPRSFEAVDEDIAAAADALLARQAAGTRLVLWGLCDGASAALLYLDRRADRRVAAVALLNPWVRSDATLARTQVRHYYGKRLLQREFWAKLMRGGIGWAALRAFGRSLRAMATPAGTPTAHPAPDFRQRMARQWRGFDGERLLMLSDADYTAREFEECARTEPHWRGALSHPRAQCVSIEGADHTLSTTGAKCRMQTELLTWLDRIQVNSRTL